MTNETSSPRPDGLMNLLELLELHHVTSPQRRNRGKQRDFSGFSFMLLAVVAVVMRTYREAELHALLSRDPDLRIRLGFVRVPHRITIKRRLEGLVPEAEAFVNAAGEQVRDEVVPEPDQPCVSAVDGRMYEAAGPKWHKRDRDAGRVPVGLRNVDTESTWSKSGYRGWVQGYRLVVQTLVFPDPVPIFAAWKPNSDNEAMIAKAALETGDFKITGVILGDETFGGDSFSTVCAASGAWVLTPKHLSKKRRSWKNDLFAYRKETIELLFQRIIQACGLKDCPVKGLGRNGALVLAAVWLYQLCFLSNYRAGKPVAHIKEIVDAARWRIPA